MIVKILQTSIVIFCVLYKADAFAEQGRWKFDVNHEKKMSGVIKGVYTDTGIYIKVLCDAHAPNASVTISYVVGKLPCYHQERFDLEDQGNLEKWHNDPQKCYMKKDDAYPDFIECFESKEQTFRCDRTIMLESEKDEPLHTVLPQTTTEKLTTFTTLLDSSTKIVNGNASSNSTAKTKRDTQRSVLPIENEKPSPKLSSASKTQVTKDTVIGPQYVIPKEGIFIITIEVESVSNFSAQIELELLGRHGYLSAVDWPLLPFYGSMCIVYFIYGVVWLIVLALQWRDLLRIQFWIGGVIFLGMLEKAAFYAEYQSVNSTGNSVEGAVLFAELVSCLKRTLARMLVVIVSLGFGIVKPRLGPMLHRVVGVGGLYFLLCSLEAFLRVMKPKNDPTKTLMLAEIPLAILDTGICWWIFSNLVQTTRTLRLRRNVVKLSLYRHFTNTLIFACVASVAFMVWVYKAHNLQTCVKDWKELWVDDAYWHLLFSIILLVIMILWRPTNNNQRYAFMPLIDSADEEEDAVLNDAFDGMKIRTSKTQNSSGTAKEKEPLKKKGDEDLAWVEENIPSSLADTALPNILDSDEEIMNTKFEMSKME